MDMFYGFGFSEDDELSDRLPSPRSWSNWGINTPDPPHESLCDTIMLTKDDFPNSEIDIDSSSYVKRQRVESSANDDLFFCYGLLENQNTPWPFFCSDEGLMAPPIVSKEAFPAGSGRYFEDYVFSPSGSWEEGDGLSSSLNLQQKEIPPEKVERTLESEDLCPEDVVLLELKAVLSKFSRKTRICFRDAFHRLAQNARQQGASQDCSTSTSSGEAMVEAGTNPIDRAVASLMFNKMDANMRGFRGSPSLSSSFSFSDQSRPFCHLSYAPRRDLSPLTGEIEAPVVGRSNHLTL